VEQVLPAPPGPEYLELGLMDPVTVDRRPGLEQVVREQRPAVGGQRGVHLVGRAGGDGPGQPEEPLGVHLDGGVGEEADGVASEDHRGAVTDGAPGVVRCGVQPGGGVLRAQIGPQRVENSLPVQAASRGESQQLDQRGRRAPRP
jgi:hypothetical protein